MNVKLEPGVIWKFPLVVQDFQHVLMPGGSDILHVAVQGGVPCLWALVNYPTERKVTRHVVMVGTGHPMPEFPYPLRYIGTFLLLDGALVYHVFEVPRG